MNCCHSSSLIQSYRVGTTYFYTTGASVPLKAGHLMPISLAGLCPDFEKQILIIFTEAKL